MMRAFEARWSLWIVGLIASCFLGACVTYRSDISVLLEPDAAGRVVCRETKEALLEEIEAAGFQHVRTLGGASEFVISRTKQGDQVQTTNRIVPKDSEIFSNHVKRQTIIVARDWRLSGPFREDWCAFRTMDYIDQ